MPSNTNSLQISSREYKLILNPKQFTGAENGEDEDKVTRAIESAIETQKLRFDKFSKKPKVKTVWYLDTDKHDLYKKNNFLIRVKEKESKNSNFDVAFKARHADKELVKGYDLFSVIKQPRFKIEEQKFEEDIITISESKFSVSIELKFEEKPNLNTWNDIIKIFPNLNLNVSDGQSLLVVNQIKVEETTYKLGEILFMNDKKAEVGLSVWCLSDKAQSPVIAEFDINVNANDLIQGVGNNNNVFDCDPAIGEINELYRKMHSQPIVDKNNKTMTKAGYVYSHRVEN